MSQFSSGALSYSSRSSRSYRRNQNIVSFSNAKALGPVSHTVIVALMLAIIGLIYLTQITKTSTYGYQINDLETRKEELMTKKQDLEVENARLQALERVSQSNVAKSMEKPTSVDYVTN